MAVPYEIWYEIIFNPPIVYQEASDATNKDWRLLLTSCQRKPLEIIKSPPLTPEEQKKI